MAANRSARVTSRGASAGLRVLASLRDSPKFRLLWISNLFFFGGAWTQTLVLGWIVFETTGSEFLLALFTAVRLLPLLLGPLGGALSDRLNRVRLLIVACAWALCAVSVVAMLASLGHAPYWVLLLGGLAIGLAQSPSQPARAALVLDLVGRDNLSNANALNAMAINLTQVVGPALGGTMISAFGAPTALWIATGWYGLSLIALLPLRSEKTARHPHQESVWQMLAGGFRAVLASRLVSAVLLVTLSANILIWPVYQSFMPVFAVDVLHLDAAGLGWMLTCYGVGGVIGSMVVAGLGDFRFKGGLFVIGTAIWGLLWAMFALSQAVPLSFALIGVIGLMTAPFIILQTTLLLITNPPGMQGRALGMQELVIGVMPLSALVLGVVAQAVGVGPTTVGCGLLLAAAMMVVAVKVPELVRYSGIQQP
jgi:predicted MFS family arabinose efflux permease